ncbi:hypothetical protein B0T22DRAFT_446648, partial [Podospora appendiculata]
MGGGGGGGGGGLNRWFRFLFLFLAVPRISHQSTHQVSLYVFTLHHHHQSHHIMQFRRGPGKGKDKSKIGHNCFVHLPGLFFLSLDCVMLVFMCKRV